MTRIGKKKLAQKIIAQDRDIVAALEKIDGYQPGSADLTTDAVKSKRDDMIAKQMAAVQAEAAMFTAKDDATAAEEAFHDLVLRAKKAVLAQFGEDSNEAQELGLKKKSEYNRPKRREVTLKKAA